MTGEEEATGKEEGVQTSEKTLTGVGGEIDEEVSAEDDPVGFVAGKTGGVHQIVMVKGDLAYHEIRQLPPLPGILEKEGPATLQGGSKRALAIAGLLGAFQGPEADVHPMDGEGRRGQTGIEKGHDDGTGLFAGRTGRRENVQNPPWLGIQQAFGLIAESRRVPCPGKSLGFSNDNLGDQSAADFWEVVMAWL
jgi:hypothetical protein